MIPLRRLSPESIPSALEKAVRYRLLNEPHEAESICLDILDVAPAHQEALVNLLLALTDQFSSELYPSFQKAMEAADRLDDAYCKAYYTGIIYERRAKAHLRQGDPGSGGMVYDWFSKALEAFERAIKGCAPDHQDAVLRWNSCARILNSRADVKPVGPDYGEPFLDSYETPH